MLVDCMDSLIFLRDRTASDWYASKSEIARDNVSKRDYSFKIIPSLTNKAKTFFTSINVKFIFDSARLGLFSSANILQIADVTLWVVF